jgi:hypothetical protein
MASMNDTKEMETYVGQITTGATSASLHEKETFCAMMAREHRTHQQSFTRLCVVWLMYVGQEGYQTDPRNQCSADLGKEFVDCVDKRDIDPYLPMI